GRKSADGRRGIFRRRRRPIFRPQTGGQTAQRNIRQARQIGFVTFGKMKNHSDAVVFTVLLLLADYAAAAETPWQTEWKKTVAAAEKEGQLVIYLGGAASQTKIEEAFQSAYPKIKIAAVAGRGS